MLRTPASSAGFSQPLRASRSAGTPAQATPWARLSHHTRYKMQCYICVTYLVILCSARPTKDKSLIVPHQRKSLFRDVIESFRIRTQLPENLNQNLENNIGQSYERYGYENDLPQLPNDAEFIPRRNDRIEMPPLKYRFPKNLLDNNTEENKNNVTREEVVVYIDTSDKITRTTQKTKKQKRPQPTGNKNKNPIKYKDQEEEAEEEESITQKPESFLPMSYTMSGQSQIGNRESQTVVKPTVIVNFRGTLNHRDSDVRLESRSENDTLDSAAQNIFNINQEVNFENRKDIPHSVFNAKGADIRQELRITEGHKAKPKVEEDMLMCETATWHPQKNIRQGRKTDSVLQILFSI